MTADTMLASKDSPPRGELDTYVEPFPRHLRTMGYAERTLRKKRTIVAAFVRWTKQEHVTLDNVQKAYIAA